MIHKTRCKGQSTLEYAVLIAVVVGALVAMQIYMKRGIQGKLRQSTDQIGEQFEANATNFEFTTTHSGTTIQTVQGGVTTVNTLSDIRTESGTENVAAWEDLK
jgi:uncharacterized protein (UPF0333 family)